MVYRASLRLRSAAESVKDARNCGLVKTLPILEFSQNLKDIGLHSGPLEQLSKIS
jgi:hypothetical protein